MVVYLVGGPIGSTGVNSTLARQLKQIVPALHKQKKDVQVGTLPVAPSYVISSPEARKCWTSSPPPSGINSPLRLCNSPVSRFSLIVVGIMLWLSDGVGVS